MKSIASILSIIALGLGVLACSSSGGGGGGGGGVTFAITTTAAPFGVVSNDYSATMATTGGTAPLTWILFGGVLPTGLSLNAGTGVVSGIPTAAGNPTVVFVVTDSTGKTATGSVLFAVHTRTDLVSVDNNTPPIPGGAASSSPSVSNDGRFVAFASSANLIPGVVGPQIYLHDWQTNQTSLVSRDSGVAITAGNGTKSAPSISSDGSFVVFVANSTNLVIGVSGQQIYLRDVQAEVTSLVSKDNFGNRATGGSTTSSPSISANGRFVAYVSDATNLVTGVVVGQQIYMYDTQISVAFLNGKTTLISKDNSLTPLPGDGASSTPSVSRDGCFVAFASLSTNLIFPAPGNQQIYVRGPLPGPGTCGASEQTSLISKDNNVIPLPGNNPSSAPSVNSSGRFVTFTSLASNLLPSANGQQIYLHDRNAGPNGTTSLISKDNSATPLQGNGNSSVPSISDDGCFVAFASLSTNFGVPGGNQQIYARGPLSGPGICVGTEQTSLVSKDNSLVAGNGLSNTPSVNANGGFVAFSSLSTNLGVVGGNQQIYVRALP